MILEQHKTQKFETMQTKHTLNCCLLYGLNAAITHITHADNHDNKIQKILYIEDFAFLDRNRMRLVCRDISLNHKNGSLCDDVCSLSFNCHQSVPSRC